MSKRSRRNKAAQRHQSGPQGRATVNGSQAPTKIKARAMRPPSGGAGWFGSGGHGAPEARGLPIIRSRARDLVHNNPYAAAAVEILTSHTVGTGVRAAISNDDEFEAYYRAWADSTEADEDGRLTYYGHQQLAARSMYEGGDGIIIMRERKIGDKLALTLQSIDPDMVQEGAAPKYDGNTVHAGVEVDPDGRRVGMHIRPDLESFETVFIQERDIIHLMEIEYGGQVRGIPRGARAQLATKDVDEFFTAAHRRAKAESCTYGVVTSPDATQVESLFSDEPEESVEYYDEMDGRYLVGESLREGGIMKLNTGETYQSVAAPASNGVGDYIRLGLRAVAVGYGVMYDQISGDLSSINFASFKAGKMDFNRRIDVIRAHAVIPQFLKIIRRLREVFEVNEGRISQANVRLTPPGRESIEPAKDALADMTLMSAGLLTFSQACHKRGLDPEEQIKELRSEREKLAGIDIQFGQFRPSMDALQNAADQEDAEADEASKPD